MDLLKVQPVACRNLEIVLILKIDYLCQGRPIVDIDVFPFFVKMKIVLSLGIASLLVPIPYKRFGFKLAVEIGGLPYNKISIHQFH